MSEIVGWGGGYYSRRGEQRPDHCPNCDRDTSLAERDRRLIWPDISDNLVVPSGDCVFEVALSCTYCEQTIVEMHLYGSERGSTESEIQPDEIRMIWPPRSARELHESAPDQIRSLFMEASQAEFAGALRGAAALYRAAVEELCRDRGAAGSNLESKINDLANRGVEQDVVSDLHEARVMGNWSLHDGLAFDAAEVADVADLIGEAVEVLYVQPSERHAMREARQARRNPR